MRLALLSPLPPEQTGIADYAAHFRRAINAAGVQVLTPLQGQRPLDSLVAARRWVDERDWSKVDVVHAELGGGRYSEFFALDALSRLPSPPALSVTVHDPERLVWRPVHRWWPAMEHASVLPRLARQALAVLSDPHTLWAERRLARRLDGLVALTDIGATRLAARMGVPKSRISVIPHGTLALPQEPLPPLQPMRLLYFGFIYSGKGIEDLVDALGRVIAAQSELASQVRLTIAGGTAPDITFGAQGSYLDGLRKRVAQRGLQAQVDWELDVDPHDIAPLIRRHHVMVLPYRESRKLALLGQMRGTSGALAWAIACGRGAITSDARAFAEEIQSGNGESYKQGDVAALAQGLERLLVEPQRASTWAQQASELARQRDWTVTGQRFRAHFDALLARHAAHAPMAGRGRPAPAASKGSA
ncbi:MAG TPA: glycosyltransferase [Aquabacterium sp.]|uniref:glycosyltransferase n=1 Tax=Aquabacterium sp. TaxID=1872578 RepID=UPI002E32CDF3|nr:glycosyltransferase [Aquabacterium sp.]HEX5372950.1 glycosyltransferase [Aquabacterium sp.]